MKEKKTYKIWEGNKYGDYGSVDLFIEWWKREIDEHRSDTIGIFDLGKGKRRGVTFDIEHMDKMIKTLKQIKREYNDE